MQYNTKTMPNMITDKIMLHDRPLHKYEMTFRSVGGIWRRVDSQEPNPLTLAETLKQLNIVIDDAAQFCRIIHYYEGFTKTITYRAYNQAKVTITINLNKYV